MKGVKCFGLLSAFSIMLGLSLSVSLDTSALKHQVSGMPLYVTRRANSNNQSAVSPNQRLAFTFLSSQTPSFDYLKLPRNVSSAPHFFQSRLSGSSCSWLGVDYSNVLGRPNLGNNNQLSWGTFYNDIGFSDNCNSLDPFGSNNKPSFPSDISADYPQLRNLNPYSFEYNAFMYHDTWKSADSGLVYDSDGFSLSDTIGFYNTHLITSPYSLSIPFGNFSDYIPYDSEPLNVGSTVDFYYEIYLTDLVSYDLTVSENAVVSLQYSYSSSGSIYTDSVLCNKDISYDGYGERFQFTCPFVSPRNIDDNNISFNYLIIPGEGYSSIWDVVFTENASTDYIGGDIAFYTQGLYIVTNNDITPANEIGPTLVGSKTNRAPGSAASQFDPDRSEANYNSSLTSMFNFGFFNPFQPLFNLFVDDSSCVQIPTISSWLHTEDTEVCHWFPSNIRQVLTPVFGLFSSMLVFGFAVRWLGGSSGNMFIDDDVKDTGRSFSLRNKYRRLR